MNVETEQQLVERAAALARVSSTKPSAEQCVTRYLERRGVPEPLQHEKVSERTRGWWVEWHRLCERVLDVARPRRKEVQRK